MPFQFRSLFRHRRRISNNVNTTFSSAAEMASTYRLPAPAENAPLQDIETAAISTQPPTLGTNTPTAPSNEGNATPPSHDENLDIEQQGETAASYVILSGEIATPAHEDLMKAPPDEDLQSISIVNKDPVTSSFEDAASHSYHGPPSPAPIVQQAYSNIIMQKASGMDPISRFYLLLHACESLILAHGPYRASPSNIFSRAPVFFTGDCPVATSRDYACSFSAAQDAIRITQPRSPAAEDLQVFAMLWDTTKELLEIIISRAELDNESLGWGVFGLAAGYKSPEDTFVTLKSRLHTALLDLPCIYRRPSASRIQTSRSPGGRVHNLANANRQTHICSVMLLQTMQSNWERVRWYFAACVAEQWVKKLGWDGDVSWQVVFK
ncbi:hypothetical protein BCR34DRAFT_608340 [Clohesyomyces aquaticus]|uniref:Uncharacterized protein n=1 Tax=Clohesyomyces aquaticus TaxID=1231657 RepID=A0A1Y1Y868_9PLEO|nr:hypothetical protein BCR34DRAFT_608340 [Clohesyomyces aquaticus]